MRTIIWWHDKNSYEGNKITVEITLELWIEALSEYVGSLSSYLQCFAMTAPRSIELDQPQVIRDENRRKVRICKSYNFTLRMCLSRGSGEGGEYVTVR